MIATWIWILTAFSDSPQKVLTRNCIKSAMKFEVFRETQVLSDGHHIKGKLFEYSMISDGVSLGQYLTIDCFFTKPEEKRFLTMCNCDICEFSQTATTYKLPK